MFLRRWIAALRQRYLRLPLLNRLLLGNTIVIVFGAVAGTLITREIHRVMEASDVWLIGFFAAAGILLSLLVNYWIVKTTLRPLHALRQAVDQVEDGWPPLRLPLVADSDPDLTRLAAAINSMLERVDDRTQQLRALSARAISAQEDERKRIARGLHDDIGQALSMLMIHLERMEATAAEEAPDLQPALATTRQLARRTLDDLRKVVYALRPSMLDDLGLAAAIRWYARSTLEGAGIRVCFGEFDEALRLEPSVEITLFRIAQEAINNILHHSGAHTVRIALASASPLVRLVIEDDGRGFDVAQSRSEALRLRRFGLLGIRERAELAGGTVTLRSAPGTGTRLEVSVPV